MQNFSISDSHNDFLTDTECVLGNLDEDFKNNNVKLCNAILYSNEDNPLDFSKAEKLREKVDKYENLKKNCIFSFENVGFIKNNIDKLFSFSPFSVSLTWNNDNKFAGGAMGFSGLSNKGKSLIKELLNNKIIIDTAHLNRRSFWDIINMVDCPIFNSHTSISTFKEHRRNIDIEQLKAIVDSNGFVGITFIKDLFSNKKRVSCNKIFYVIDSIVQVFGINNIGIGSDFFGTKKLPYNLKGYDDMQNLFKCFKMYGYNENDISKIMCDNFIDFVKRQKSICNS